MNKKSTLMGMSLIICLTTFILFSLTGCQEEESKLWVDDYVQEFPPGTDDYVPLRSLNIASAINVLVNCLVSLLVVPLILLSAPVGSGISI